MKRLLTVVLALVMAVSLFAGCAQQQAAEQPAEQAPQETAAAPAENNGTQTDEAASSVEFEEMTIKLGHVLESSHHNQKACEYFANLVSEKTGGKVTVEIYPAEQLGTEADEFSALSLGTQEMGLFGIGESAKVDKRLSIFDSSYVFANRQHLLNVMQSDLFYDLADDSAGITGVRTLAGTYYGTRELSCNTKVESLADMKGLKIRCPDQEVFLNVINALGAKPSPMSLGEVYLALSQGVIDGQENPLATIISMKFYEVQKYITMTNHIINADFFMCSESWYAGLSDEMKTVISESAKEAAAYINEVSFEEEDAARAQLEELGVEFIDLSDEAMAEFVAAGSPTDEMIETWGGADYYAKIQAMAE